MKIDIDKYNDDILRLQELYQNTKRNQIQFLETLTEKFIKKHLKKYAERTKNRSAIVSHDTNYWQKPNIIRRRKPISDIYEINLRMVKNNSDCKITAINHFQDYFCEKWTREERCKKYGEIFSKFFPNTLEPSILNDSVEIAIKKNIIRQNRNENRVSDFVFTKNDVYSNNRCPQTNGVRLTDAILLNKEHEIWDEDIDSRINEKNIKYFSKLSKKNKIKDKKKKKITKRQKEITYDKLSHTDSYASLNANLTVNNSEMFVEESNWAIENIELLENNRDNFKLNDDSACNSVDNIRKRKKRQKEFKKGAIVKDFKTLHNEIKWAYACIGNSELSEICANNFVSNGKSTHATDYSNKQKEKCNKEFESVGVAENFEILHNEIKWAYACIGNSELSEICVSNFVSNGDFTHYNIKDKKKYKKGKTIYKMFTENLIWAVCMENSKLPETNNTENSELLKWADTFMEDNKLSEIKPEISLSIYDKEVNMCEVNDVEIVNKELDWAVYTEDSELSKANRDNFIFHNKTGHKVEKYYKINEKKKKKMTKRQEEMLQKDHLKDKLNYINSNTSLDANIIKSSETFVGIENNDLHKTDRNNLIFYNESVCNETDHSIQDKKEINKTAAVKNSEIFDEEIRWANTCIKNDESSNTDKDGPISNNKSCNTIDCSIKEKEEYWREMKFNEIFDKELNWADMCTRCTELPVFDTKDKPICNTMNKHYMDSCNGEINKFEKDGKKKQIISNQIPQALVANIRISVIKQKVNAKRSKNGQEICLNKFDTDYNDFLAMKRNIESHFSEQLVYSDNRIVLNYNDNIYKIGKILFKNKTPEFYPIHNISNIWPKEMKGKNVAINHKNETISVLSKNRCAFISFPMTSKEILSMLPKIEVSNMPDNSNFELKLGDHYNNTQQKNNLYFKNKCIDIGNEIKNRYDFRHMDTFAIVVEKASFINFAFSCNILENKNYEIFMHISDVSYYLSNEILYEMLTSRKICMNTFPKAKNHIFPRGWCTRFSLCPRKDKLAISIIWEIDENGNILDTQFVKSVINCNNRFKFKHLKYILTTSKPKITNNYTFNILAALKVLFKVADILRIQRLTSHKIIKLHKENIKYNLKRGFKYECSNLTEDKYGLQHLCEEYEILANLSVAQHMYKTNADILLLRMQPQPAFPKNEGSCVFENIQKLLWSPIHNKESKARVIVLNNILSRIMPKEYYKCMNKLENRESTVNNLYTHFTRPIERYFDIVAQRFFFHLSKDATQNNLLDINKITEIIALCNDEEKEMHQEKSILSELYFVKYLLNSSPIEIDAIVYKIDSSSFQIITYPFSYIKRFEFHTFCKEYKCSITSCASSKNGIQKVIITWLDSDGKTEELKVLTYIKVLLSVNSETKEITVSFFRIPQKKS